jgi:hypothetical protein
MAAALGTQAKALIGMYMALMADTTYDPCLFDLATLLCRRSFHIYHVKRRIAPNLPLCRTLPLFHQTSDRIDPCQSLGRATGSVASLGIDPMFKKAKRVYSRR